MLEPWQLSGQEALLQIRQGTLTVEAYAGSLLKRIQQRNPIIHAWVYLQEDSVLAQARALDQLPEHERGPLHGLPIGVKDIMLTKDMPTQYNSKLYETQVPIGVDAAPVAILRACGALIFGKLSTTEFATTPQGGWHQNLTANPSDTNRTPGGSSSGSGAAVADYQIPIALGTQTGGSIIRPASFNGCFGWKPTWGIISREGLAQWCITLDTCGFFARTVGDLEQMAEAFRVKDDTLEEQRNSLKDTRIAFCQTPYWSTAQAGTEQAMMSAKDQLQRVGALCDAIELPADFAFLKNWHSNILAGEGRAAFLSHYLKDKSLLHEQIRRYVENGANLNNKDLRDAYDGCARLRPVWDQIAAQYDAVIVPSVPDEAPEGLEHTGDMSLCSMWTALHAPVINIPGFQGANGLPIGLSVVGGRNTDRALLRNASLIAAVFQDHRVT